MHPNHGRLNNVPKPLKVGTEVLVKFPSTYPLISWEREAGIEYNKLYKTKLIQATSDNWFAAVINNERLTFCSKQVLVIRCTNKDK